MIFKALYLAFILNFIGSAISRILPEVQTNLKTRTVDSKWIHNDPDGTESMPDAVRLELRLGGRAAPLNLVRRPTTAVDPSIVLAGSEWTFPRNEMLLAAYEEKATGALFTLAVRYAGGSKEALYMAKFPLGDNFYLLSPGDFNITDRTLRGDIAARATTRLLVIDGTLHSLVEYKRSPSPGVNCPDKNVGCGIKTTAKVRKRSTAKRSHKKQLTIEVFVVVDNSIYKDFFLKAAASSDEEKRNRAMASVVYMFAHIMNSVKDHFEAIEDDSVRFTARMVGIYVAERPEDAPFIEKAKIDDSSIDAGSALGLLWRWAFHLKGTQPDGNAFKLPDFDVLLAFSSHTLYYRSGLVLGLAYLGGVCRFDGVTLNAYRDYFDTVTTTSHELGHSLGAEHDGDGNNCHPHKYIMNANPKDVMHFSRCSARRFKHKMKELNDSNCLLVNEHPDFVHPLIDLYPGQIYDLDAQCRATFGPDHFFFEWEEPRENLCQKFYCWNEGVVKASRPLDGTSCSNGAWCHRNKCTADKRAPKSSAHCINGDSKIRFTYRRKSMSCKDLIDEHPKMCNYQYFRRLCCASCTGKRMRYKGCQDKINECPKLRPRDCYNAYFATTCCSTCKSLVQNRSEVGCPYGDRGIDCPDLVPYICHLDASYCCRSCAPFV